jgi:hypothetical protein
VTRRKSSFGRNVFINCPADSAYQELLRPLLFTVVSLGYEPRLAIARSDSGEDRLRKICGFIIGSRYSIHDLSRMRATQVGQLARMNMPFELGVDYGTRKFGPQKVRGKKFLILEKELHTFRKALSDLSGVDIKKHANDARQVIGATRSWFVETVGVKGAPSPKQLWYRFAAFADDFQRKRKSEGFSKADLNMMPVPEYIAFMKLWLRNQSNTRG